MASTYLSTTNDEVALKPLINALEDIILPESMRAWLNPEGRR